MLRQAIESMYFTPVHPDVCNFLEQSIEHAFGKNSAIVFQKSVSTLDDGNKYIKVAEEIWSEIVRACNLH